MLITQLVNYSLYLLYEFIICNNKYYDIILLMSDQLEKQLSIHLNFLGEQKSVIWIPRKNFTYPSAQKVKKKIY